MKVLLLKDVYKLGRAGDVKKVADGYGRNYLLPQRLAVMATEGALRQAVKIREAAAVERPAGGRRASGRVVVVWGVGLLDPPPPRGAAGGQAGGRRLAPPPRATGAGGAGGGAGGESRRVWVDLN